MSSDLGAKNENVLLLARTWEGQNRAGQGRAWQGGAIHGRLGVRPSAATLGMYLGWVRYLLTDLGTYFPT